MGEAWDLPEGGGGKKIRPRPPPLNYLKTKNKGYQKPGGDITDNDGGTKKKIFPLVTKSPLNSVKNNDATGNEGVVEVRIKR